MPLVNGVGGGVLGKGKFWFLSAFLLHWMARFSLIFCLYSVIVVVIIAVIVVVIVAVIVVGI